MCIVLAPDALTHLFCHVHDFCQAFLPAFRAHQIQQAPTEAETKTRNRARSLCESEIMTLLIAFHQSGFRTFKQFYTGFVCTYWKGAFPTLVSYNRFVEFIPWVLPVLYAYLRSLMGQCSGVSFADSTALAVCHNRRIKQHRVFAGIAQRGKTSVDWFFGFKLHLLINEHGELLNLTLTPGNVDDRTPLPDLTRGLFGRIFADKGYVSEELARQLANQGIALVTKPRKNMKPKPLSVSDRVLLGKRGLIESVVDQLKNQSQVEHTRHRAATGFLWNLASALIAYCHQPDKPNLQTISNAPILRP